MALNVKITFDLDTDNIDLADSLSNMYASSAQDFEQMVKNITRLMMIIL